MDTTDLRRTTYHEALASIEEIIEDARNGKMFILIDDEDRENEGDLVIPAEMATPEAVNFMAKFGRGLICLAMTRERIDELGLPLMPRKHSSRHETAFTVSIEAKDGVTTGISAADRARTIAVAIDPACNRDEIVTPGHVFPLVAREGGVLVRAGHTEAAVDLARMAGLLPAGVICEIMNDDGTMARLPDLIQFAQYHGLKVGTIADLIAHRRRTESIVRRSLESQIDTLHGGAFRMVIYVNKVTYAEHIALVKGDISTSDPVLVRMHALNVLDDVLGDRGSGKGGQLQAAMQQIAAVGRGVVVLIREPSATTLSDTVRARLEHEGAGGELRDYGVGAQILLDLGIRDMILLSNSQKNIVGLDGYGLSIVERRPISIATEKGA
ncbi:MAG: 3,4-dihydroxy-2-butanone-4-phosphate synthase [Oceanibaculum nanhaiense]|uniref:3,4-dihydroxy-2-butanone-4-phosphate synthase n=1 Tax=Oceanibaculum nanhaiense TaxID=1909734 RepID=UPI0025A39D62|nr:3,4-dihydroxy-2-butanone-4-phosphate synthase [Oceanibaculum nanhaiense]MDM7946343.1 3,4-dihydroxy-2-butanone-4-phosphate synthase [Oceanibaculum nanhaiense]